MRALRSGPRSARPGAGADLRHARRRGAAVSPRARSARPPAAPVAFRGPPHRLSSLVELPDAPHALGEPKALLEGAEIRGLGVRALTREAPGFGKVTLRLPKSTPPGTYSGSVEVGGRKLPVVVEVEPRPKIEA